MNPTIRRCDVMTHSILCNMTVHSHFTKRYCFVATIQMMLRQWIKRDPTHVYLQCKGLHHSLFCIRLFSSWELPNLNEYSTTLYFFITLRALPLYDIEIVASLCNIFEGELFIVTSCTYSHYSQPVWHCWKRLVSWFSSVFSYNLQLVFIYSTIIYNFGRAYRGWFHYK